MAIGSIIGAIAGNSAAKTEAKAANNASALSQKQYEQSRADLAPWRLAGTAAVNKLAMLQGLAAPAGMSLSDAQKAAASTFTQSPGYGFRLSEGLKAVDRGAASRGLLRSGRTLKAEQEYGEGLAANEYDAWANRLMSTAGLGQNATTTTGNLGVSAAGQQAAAGMAAGQARASGYTNIGSAANNAISNAMFAKYLGLF